MRAALLFVILVLAPALAFAGQMVWLPSGAQWAVVAPKAGNFAAEAGAFLKSASKDDPPLSARLVNNDFVRETGLALLSASELAADGVDLDRPWTMFERRGATYLDVFVQDRVRLQAALDAWGADRLLKSRVARRLSGGGVVVTFGRARGTRAAAGYVLVRDQVVVLLTAARAPALQQALAAVEGAVPVRAPAAGTLVVWSNLSPVARDAWLVLRASADGLALRGAARNLQPGWLTVDGGRGSWLSGLTASVPAEQAARLRFVAGERSAQALARRFVGAPGAGESAATNALGLLAQGPDEVVVAQLVPPEGRGPGVTDEAVAKLVAPSLVLPDRAELPAVLREVPTRLGNVHGARLDGADLLGLGPNAPLAPPPPPSGPPSLTCPRGLPVAALRVDTAVVARSLGTIGFFDTLRDPLLLGLYGVRAQFGQVATKLQPLLALACVGGGHLYLVGRVSFRR